MTSDVVPPGRSHGASRWLGLKVAVLSLVVAAPTGAAWWFLAPLPALQVTAGGVVVAGTDTEVFVAADGWFAACAAVAGALCAVIAFVAVRRASVAVLLGLTVGGLLAAAAAWQIGVFLGPAPVDVQARSLAVGDRFTGPLEISAPGVLLAWPLAAVAVYFSLVAGLVESPKPGDAGGRHRRR